MDPVIIFEDDSILVVNKPAGMVVNKADTTRHMMTLQDWAEQHVTSNMLHVTADSEFAKRIVLLYSYYYV